VPETWTREIFKLILQDNEIDALNAEAMAIATGASLGGKEKATIHSKSLPPHAQFLSNSFDEAVIDHLGCINRLGYLCAFSLLVHESLQPIHT
jgi:hypothetical protein